MIKINRSIIYLIPVMFGFLLPIKVNAKNVFISQASELSNLSKPQIISKIAPLFQRDQKESGILASVSMAQFILESNYGKSKLSKEANNLFGMRVGRLNNSWHNASTWDKKSIYSTETKEWRNSEFIWEPASFRKYSSIQQSISDHSAYLNNAKLESGKKQYEGLQGCENYRIAFEIIKKGGYATDPKYVDKLCSIVKKYNLTKYDIKSPRKRPPRK